MLSLLCLLLVIVCIIDVNESHYLTGARTAMSRPYHCHCHHRSMCWPHKNIEVRVRACRVHLEYMALANTTSVCAKLWCYLLNHSVLCAPQSMQTYVEAMFNKLCFRLSIRNSPYPQRSGRAEPKADPRGRLPMYKAGVVTSPWEISGGCRGGFCTGGGVLISHYY